MLDPKGARALLFERDNKEAVRVGDVLLVRQKNGEPFSGTCLNIRRQGLDTAVLLRNHVTRVGVEMWFKIYSPNVTAIEVVQRAKKRARRARLYYLRCVILSREVVLAGFVVVLSRSGADSWCITGNRATIRALWTTLSANTSRGRLAPRSLAVSRAGIKRRARRGRGACFGRFY